MPVHVLQLSLICFVVIAHVCIEGVTVFPRIVATQSEALNKVNAALE